MNRVQVQSVWDSQEAFDRCTGKGIVADGAGVKLWRGVTVRDEAGRCNQNDRENIAGLRQARKVFSLPSVSASQAVLCPFLHCDRVGGELDIEVNGHTLRVDWPEKRPYWEDRWRRIPVSVDWLREGQNEVVFRAVGEAQWTLLIEESLHPDRSAVSEDGGKTWRSEDLGVNDRADGEYMVRLWLDQHAESGELCSDSVDVLASDDGVGQNGRVLGVQVQAVADALPGTRIDVEWRGGPTPVYDPASWTAWDLPGKNESEIPVRFVQWRVHLATDDPGKSPVLKQVVLDAEVEVDGELSCVRVVEAKNEPLVRSLYRFATLPADSKRGATLRERWSLNDVIRPAKSEFEAFLHLRQWVREQWEDGWNMGEIDFCPPWDGMLILELAGQKLSLGMCTHYATVMSHCCAALGLTARTQIMRAHCINEVWSSEHGKWVAMDVGGDANDETKFTYHFERDGVPLSALDAHQAWVEKDYGDVKIVPQPPVATGDRFEVEKRLELFSRFMISLRNDELETMGPGEPEHGKISYHYDGYLFWQDEETESLPWFSKHTQRPGDMYWSVNRAVIHLQQTSESGVLRVDLETETPNLRGFEVRHDNGDFDERPEAVFEWKLREGQNEMVVRPVNAFGRKGAESRIVVAFAPKN